MGARDRVARWALGCGGVVALLAARIVGPWGSLVVVLLALGAAALVYRLEAPRIDVDHPEDWPAGAADRDPAERVDQ